MKKLTLQIIIGFVLLSFSNANASENFQKYLARFHDSGAYSAEITRVIDEAKSYLMEQIYNNRHANKKQRLAIVFDIDETTLSNYATIYQLHFHAGDKSFRKFLLKGNAPAIIPSLELYKLAKQNNVATFFITGRDPGLHFATISNLRSAGYHDWDGIYFKPSHYHEKSVISFKSSIRGEIENMGYLIIASIGDQKSDILGGHASKGFKLPNPYYEIT